MAILVKKTTITNKTISSELDFLSNLKADKATKDKIREEVGEFLLEQTLLAVGEAKSPVEGEKFKKLSKEYRKFKESKNRLGIANLEFRGDMLNALEYKPTANGIEIGMINSSEADKSDGHNNFSGKSDLPKRRFLPDKGQSYKKGIESEVNKIINDVIGESKPLTRTTLAAIQTKSDFWDTFTEIYPDLTRAEIRGILSRSDEMSSLLAEFGILDFLL